VKVVGISVDSVEVNHGHTQKMHFTFPLLSDADASVVRRYDVLHRGFGPKGNDIARPAEFLVDTSGTVRWVNLTDDFRIRARPEQIIEAAKVLQ